MVCGLLRMHMIHPGVVVAIIFPSCRPTLDSVGWLREMGDGFDVRWLMFDFR